MKNVDTNDIKGHTQMHAHTHVEFLIRACFVGSAGKSCIFRLLEGRVLKLKTGGTYSPAQHTRKTCRKDTLKVAGAKVTRCNAPS